jgi:hypothetical protein
MVLRDYILPAGANLAADRTELILAAFLRSPGCVIMV